MHHGVDLNDSRKFSIMIPLIFTILLLACLQETVFGLIVDYEKCHPIGSHASVQAYNCFYPAIKSCKSLSVNRNKEVHYVHMYPSQTSDPAMILENSVKIYLKKLPDNNASIILILHSDVDLTWDLILPDHMESKLVIWISSNTMLMNKRVKVSQFRHRKNTLEWVNKMFGVITSHVEISRSVDVLQLHLDGGFEKQCHLKDNEQQNIAYKKQGAVILSCIFDKDDSTTQSQNQHREDIHIIEFHSLPSGDRTSTTSTSKPIVTLDLKSTGDFRNMWASIIINSHVDVIFKVNMDSYAGQVNIRTNQEINNDAIQNQMLSVSAENFDSMTSEGLYNWTSDRHGNPRTFSKIFEANLVEVYIGSDQPISSLYVMGAPPFEDISHQSQYHRLDVAHDVTVECHKEFFSVAIVKQDNLLQCDWLTLSDENCRARSNSTHCILDSKYGQCRACSRDGTVLAGDSCYGDDADGRYKNEILFHNYNKNGETNQNGSPVPNVIKLDCSTSTANLNNNYNYSNNVKDLYFKLLIHREEISNVKAIQKMLKQQHPRKFYVEALVDPEGSMVAIIEDCRLESTTPWKNVYIHHLVRKRCPVGSVEWWRYPTKEKPLPAIFSFNLDDAITISNTDNNDDNNLNNGNSNYNNLKNGDSEEFWKVVCRVAPCFISGNMSASDIPQCSSEDYSKCLGPHKSFSYSRSSSSKRLVVNVTSFPLSSAGNRASQSEHLKGGHEDGDDNGRGRTREEIFQMMIAGGDLNDKGESRSMCTEDHRRLSEYVSMEIGIVVSFCAFLVGILTMSALWLIYAKRRPKKLIGSKHLRSPDTSGESTPSSTSPITICPIKRK